MSKINPGEVRQIFEYSAGRLIWREDRGSRAKSGTVAGCKGANGQHSIRIAGVRHMRSRLVWAWHTGAWPVHTICHANHDSSDDTIGNLLDLAPTERRLMQRYKQRDLPAGVAPARRGSHFSTRVDGRHQGTYASADEAHEAYRLAHVARYGSASPWATGGTPMSFANGSYSAPTESFFGANGQPAGPDL